MRSLDEIYAEIPALPCKRKCQECCGPIAFTPIEARLMEAAGADDDVVAMAHPVDGTYWLTELVCPLLDWKGDCSIYEARPFICRLWGVIESMKCPHGCVPVGGFLPERDGVRLLAEAMQAGGAKYEPGEVLAGYDKNPGDFFGSVQQGMSNERRRKEQRERARKDRRGIGRI